MASPKIEVFFVYSAATGAPLTGLTPTFSTYKDDTGSNLAQPSITEIGGGAYKFTPTFADLTKGIVYVVDAGATAASRYFARYMRPEDWNDDYLGELYDYTTGVWQVHTSGPDANRIVFYKQDGVTVVAKYDLKDSAGAATATNAYKRVKV